MKKNKLLLLCRAIQIIILLTVTLYGQEQDENNLSLKEETGSAGSSGIFSLKGQFKNLYTQAKTDEYSKTGKDKTLIADLTRLRLSPELNLSENLLIHVDYDNEIIAANYLKSPEFNLLWRTSEYNDLFHLSREPYYSGKLYYRTRIHRAYAKVAADKVTATAGRQQIRFGSGRLWNPLDILNPIQPTNIEGPEEQKGTDALRVEYYPSDKTEIGLIFDQRRINDRLDESDFPESTNIMGRVRTTIIETEIAALGGRVSHRSLAGADISTILYGGTLRGSLLYSNPDEGKPYYIAGAGYEYNFTMGLYFLVEYFYNQIGLNYNKRLRDAIIESRIIGMNERNSRELSNQFLTNNQHYAGMALGYDITALVRGEIFTIYDFQGRGIFINPSVKYNVFQNIDVAAGVMTGHVFKGASKTSDFEALAENALFSASIVWFF